MTARACRECGEPIFWDQGAWLHGTPRKVRMVEHVAIPSAPLVHLPNMWCDGGPSCPGARKIAVGECSAESGAA